MSFITNDTFPIEEIKKFLTGKGFCRQSKKTKAKVTGVIQDISLSFKIVFDAEQEKVFFKPVIQIQSTKGVWYDLCEIWIQSVTPYQDYGGTMIMEAVNNPFPNGIKLPEEFTKDKKGK